MRQVLCKGWCVVLLLGATYVYPQGLFESSQSGNHENMVSNSYSLGGFIRPSLYVSNLPESDHTYLQSIYAQAGFQLSARAGEHASGKAEVRFRYGNEFQQSVSELEIREVYVDLSAGPVGARVGKLISPWGKGTLFNPVDKVTPLDPTVRSPEEDDMHLGVWAMEARISLGPSMKISGLWKPLYQSSVMLIDPVPMPAYIYFLDPEQPGMRLKDGSYGIRYDLHSRIIDASFYWFEGYHHWPGIGFDSFSLDTATMEPLAMNLREKPYRIRMAGADFSIPLGSWILRAEGAWQHATRPLEEEEYLPLPELSYTAELERTGTYGTLLAGYYGKYVMDHTTSGAEPSLQADQAQFLQLMQLGVPLNEETIADLINDQLNAFNRLYNDQLEEYYHTVFFAWNGTFLQEHLELRIPVIYRITTGEWIVQPGVSYLPADGIRISIGYNGLYGPEDSLYDMVGPVLNAGYLSLKLTF